MDLKLDADDEEALATMLRVAVFPTFVTISPDGIAEPPSSGFLRAGELHQLAQTRRLCRNRLADEQADHVRDFDHEIIVRVAVATGSGAHVVIAA